MNNSKRLVKNTIIISIGKFSTQLVSFFLLPLYTAILTEAEYGTYDFICTMVLFLVPFTTLLMEEAMFRFLIDTENEKEKREVITQSILFIGLSTIIISIVLLIILSIVRYELKYYLIFYLIASIYNSISQAFSRGVSQIKMYSFAAFISSSLTLCLNVIFIVYFRLGVKGLLLAFIIANIITPTFVFIRLKIWKYIRFKYIKYKKIKDMLLYSIPLVPNSVSWVIINLSDRLVVTSVMGESANGVLAIAHKFPNMINTIYGYFYTAWKEEASRALKEGDYKSYYNDIYKVLKRFLISISLGMISVLPFVFNVLIDEKFSEAYVYIPVLIFGIYFGNISGFYGGIFSAKKDTRIMGSTTIFSAILNLVISIALIKYIGIMATVISTLIANLSVCIYRCIKLRKYIIFDKDIYFYLWTSIAILISIICYYSQSIILELVGLFVTLIYCLLANKKVLKGLLIKIKNK